MCVAILCKTHAMYWTWDCVCWYMCHSYTHAFSDSINVIPYQGIQMLIGLMGVCSLSSFIVACSFGAVGFTIMNFLPYSFCTMLLHCLSVCSIICWYCWVGLFIFIKWLSCIKLLIVGLFLMFIICFHLSLFFLLPTLFFQLISFMFLTTSCL